MHSHKYLSMPGIFKAPGFASDQGERLHTRKIGVQMARLRTTLGEAIPTNW